MKNLRLILVGLLLSSTAFAEVEVESVVRQYDDGETKVFSPSIDVSGTFANDRYKISAGWAQDVLTSASADVKTYSSKGVIDDKRTEYAAGFETLVPDGTMSVGYVQSDEDDYHSRIFSAGLTRDFFQKNTTVGIGFASGNDRINDAIDVTFDERMRHQVYSVSLTQVLSKISILQLLYDFRVENGFIASPYRRALFVDGSGNIGQPKRENHPLTRNRNAFAVKYNYFLESYKLSLATTYRLYQDSWGVLSHTLEERVTRDLTRKISVSLTGRFYTQGKAKFYEDYYTDPNTPFYTGNSTLAAYSSFMLGVRPAWAITDHLILNVKLEHYSQNFNEAVEKGQRFDTKADDKKMELSATVVGVGLSAKF